MNVLMISFGFESASNSMVKELKGTGVSQKDYQRVLDLCAHYGLYAHGNFITGTQQETVPDLQETYRFVSKNVERLTSVYFTHMTPFPGTKVWDDSIKAGLVNPEHLNYRVLNLDFDFDTSVFLNQHYEKPFYQEAHRQFKSLENWLNDRYYAEETLIKDVVYQNRHLLPEKILTLIRSEGYKSVLIVHEEETYLPKELPDCTLTFVSPHEIPASLETDAILLYFTLDHLRQPAQLLKQIRGHPILSLNHHVGNMYQLTLLLLGGWEEGVYSVRERKNLHYFTLKTLEQLMQTTHLKLSQVVKNTFSIPLDYSLLNVLDPIAPRIDVDAFSYLTLSAILIMEKCYNHWNRYG